MLLDLPQLSTVVEAALVAAAYCLPRQIQKAIETAQPDLKKMNTGFTIFKDNIVRYSYEILDSEFERISHI